MTEFKQVCSVDDLVKDSGVAVLINQQQIALFYIDSQVYATGNFDPLGKANVISRGMTGDRQGELTVASPLHKEHYSLISGKCLDKEGVEIPVYQTRIVDGYVEVAI